MLPLSGCIIESDAKIKQKLLIILDDDLKAILEDIPEENILYSAHHRIVSYKSYDKGKYTKKAVVHFIFLKKVNVRLVRKYRYYGELRKWERYVNKYQYYDLPEEKK